MSIVIGFAAKDMAIIASDGRAIDNDGNIVSEEYNKTLRINDSVVVGFAGNEGLCAYTNKIIMHIHNRRSCFVESVSIKIHDCLNNMNIPDNIICKYLVAGMSKNGNIIMQTVRAEDRYYIRTVVPENSTGCVAFTPPGIRITDYNIVGNGTSAEVLKESARSIIERVAKDTQYVNNHCYFMEVFLL